jgi:hypothetical protein
VAISAQFEYGATLRVEASWESPPDNGSPLTGFQVVLTSDRGYSSTMTLAALRSGAVEIACGSRCHGMRVQADVRAMNGIGQGPAAIGSYTHNAPAVAPLSGEVVTTGVDIVERPATTSWTAYTTFNPPFAWRTFEGTCTVNYTGPATGSRPISCWATSLNFTMTGAGGTYRFWMQAGTTRSNEVQALAYREPRDPCRTC